MLLGFHTELETDLSAQLFNLARSMASINKLNYKSMVIQERIKISINNN
ncbi:hypothetical protein VCRA2120O333_70178 [Vibrio crassostreae]|nr:hypothetical protein EDB49_11813 [Vibrio crassostreae]CAK3275915.1 hypothetical protein VCRA2122O341_180012 [Vibrio crassostreae]CAK3579443.1 hypothetical protein VCRA2121O334_70064 [Vibrio crassostreae]CAK3972593.1 hypothetical protein VCRA2120O333_70178 [Vibrio crassostreae]